MGWFNHLLLIVSPLAPSLTGERCLLVTRTGLSARSLKALSKELDCTFTVLRPAPSSLELNGPFRHLRGHCWSVVLPAYRWCGERNQETPSPLRLFQGQTPLGPGGSPFERIAQEGRGAYLHWKGRLLFSTPDNSDPNRSEPGFRLEVAPRPRGPMVLEHDHDRTGRLVFPAELFIQGEPEPPRTAILSEPPDRNLPGLLRALRGYGIDRLILRVEKRWFMIPVQAGALLSPVLLPALAGRLIKDLARGLKSRLTGFHRRHRTGLPEDILGLALKLGRGFKGLAGQERVKNQTPGADPLISLFEKDLAGESDSSRSGPWRGPSPWRIIQFIGQLGPGGAERQVCNLSAGLKEAGHQVRVLTLSPPLGQAGHYRSILDRSGVPLSQAGTDIPPGFLATALADPGLKKRLLPFIPPPLDPPIRALLPDLIRFRPQVIHCWLDWNNILGGLAGYLAGTPLILLSTRNVNPTHFPRFFRPWMKPWYSFLARSPRVRFIANSEAGALDYARWLGLEPGRFRVIHNSLDPVSLARPRTGEITAFKKELGLEAGEPLVAGIFRLDSEKRPLDFLRVIKTLRERSIRVKALIAGQGAQENRVREEIRRLGLQGSVMLLGRRKDINRVMAACQVILLTSAHEGTPNALMEAHWLGLPVVAARAGGVPETVADRKSGFLHDIGDVEGLAESVARLLADPDLAAAMGRAGRRLVKRRFDAARTIQETLDYYGESLSAGG